VGVSRQYFKVLSDSSESELKAKVFIPPNESSNLQLSSLSVSVHQVEQTANPDFFHFMLDEIEEMLAAGADQPRSDSGCGKGEISQG
jgi:hypothetical protein